MTGLVLLALTASCRRQPVYRVADGVVWHTSYHIVYESDRDLSGDIVSAMNRVERSLSPFLEQSVISCVNRGETDLVDSLIWRVWQVSEKVNRLSGGRFDPTVAPLVKLWGFGGEEVIDAPSQRRIDSCLVSVGFGECRLNGLVVEKKTAATWFNFSAVTKGFGVDEVSRALVAGGVENFLVEIGGEVFAQGTSQRGEMWRVSVDVPDSAVSPGDSAMFVLSLDGQGVATSGNYRNFHDFNGRRAGHTVSPLTGYPVKSDILSATVMAPCCMEADALATALMAMPLEEGMDMVRALGRSYRAIVIVDCDGSMKVVDTQ